MAGENTTDHQSAAGDAIFRCPLTGEALHRESDSLVNSSGTAHWRVQGNFYDFKEPMQ
jgi:hypothetical protein